MKTLRRDLSSWTEKQEQTCVQNPRIGVKIKCSCGFVGETENGDEIGEHTSREDAGFCGGYHEYKNWVIQCPNCKKPIYFGEDVPIR